MKLAPTINTNKRHFWVTIPKKNPNFNGKRKGGENLSTQHTCYKSFKMRNNSYHLRRASIASKNSGAISGFGVLIAHLTPAIPTTPVSSIRNGIPRGALADRYKTSWFIFLRFAMKNTLDAARRSTVTSTLLITTLCRSLEISFESGRDFHVCS